ncbi:CDP-glycerol glycerophosphotransferase, TagB/SpsB family [Ruminococcaceae bacterium YRB3002]|nr:CDP-glycerol glycerophosphotransferase, TagB/SpsB family [Ruminococcaceae bacterium YRB3002]
MEVLYIDPGTGGMLFTILFGLFSVVVFSCRVLLMNMKFRISGGKGKKTDDLKTPLVIFTDHKRYWNIFEPILEELERREREVLYLTCSHDDPVFSKDYKYIRSEFIGEGNKAFSKLNLLNASVVLSTTPSLDVFQWKRSRDVDCYIHIFHAPNDVTLYRMFGIDHYDALIVSGEYQEKQIRQLEELRGITPRDVEICGIPYLDEMKMRLSASGEVPPHDRTVILAPTWGTSGILSRYGERIIDNLIETGYKIIIRPHPQSFFSEKELIGNLMAKYNDPSLVEWNTDNDNFDVLRRSDILISDFSGIIFDYSLVFDKPVIYTKTGVNFAPYDAAWIDEDPWTLKILPYLGFELNDDNAGDIKTLIDTCIEDPSFVSGRQKARSETWFHIGEGTKRTVDFVLKKYDDIAAVRVEKEIRAKEEIKKHKSFSITKGWS